LSVLFHEFHLNKKRKAAIAVCLCCFLYCVHSKRGVLKLPGIK
jgi:uncharacterized membrane protein